jgi:hypothetical protein
MAAHPTWFGAMWHTATASGPDCGPLAVLAPAERPEGTENAAIFGTGNGPGSARAMVPASDRPRPPSVERFLTDVQRHTERAIR